MDFNEAARLTRRDVCAWKLLEEKNNAYSHEVSAVEILLITVLAPILNGCISHYQLRNLGDKPHASLNAASINGIYVNISTPTKVIPYSLWSKLKRCASNKGDTLRVRKTQRVKLEFDGDKT